MQGKTVDLCFERTSGVLSDELTTIRSGGTRHFLRFSFEKMQCLLELRRVCEAAGGHSGQNSLQPLLRLREEIQLSCKLLDAKMDAQRRVSDALLRAVVGAFAADTYSAEDIFVKRDG